MDRDTAHRMIAFADELEKVSGMGSILQAVRGAAQAVRGVAPARHIKDFVAQNAPGHLGQLGVGAALGGITGGAVDEDNRLRGALIGAGVGTGLAGTRILASPVERAQVAAGLKRVGARQKHYWTGKGSKTVEEAQATGLLQKAPDEAAHKAMVDKLNPDQVPKADKAFKRQQDLHKLEEDAFRAGEYSIPGTFKSMVTQPKEFFKRQWHRQGDIMGIPHAGKAFAGLSAYQTGKELSRKGEPGEEGRFTRAGKALGSGVGWFASPRGFMPGLVMAPVLGRVGGLAGKGMDKVLGNKPPPALAAPSGELTPPPAPERGV